MKKLICALSLLSQSGFAISKQEPCYTKLSEVLNCFIRHQDGVSGFQTLSKSKTDAISIESYSFNSQIWPPMPTADIPTTTWKHKIVFYIPDQIEHNTILLYAGGGYLRNKEGHEQPFNASQEYLDYKTIALKNKAVVVDLQNIPNQFLWMGGKLRREDQILAYTYKQVMSDPMKNAYLAGHLPMAKAISRGMDFTETILSSRVQKPRFVLAGISKRGWAAWLAALEDDRIEALIPIVVDVLNTQKSMLHICEVYKACPYALKDYAEEHLTDKIGSPEFANLMKIEDPFSYLGSDYHPKYKERLAIPKLIINASGDDFFVPDSSQWYFKALPGSSNFIRYLPNSLHYLKGNPISDSTKSLESVIEAVDNYFAFLLKKSTLPKIDWTFDKNHIELHSSLKPKSLKLWTAFNHHDRDFRFLNKHTTWHLFKKKLLSYVFDEICDTCYGEKNIELGAGESQDFQIQVPLPSSPNPGWRAAFLEVHYEIDSRPFIVSSEVRIDHEKSFHRDLK